MKIKFLKVNSNRYNMAVVTTRKHKTIIAFSDKKWMFKRAYLPIYDGSGKKQTLCWIGYLYLCIMPQ
jgi:hypothetical protein